MAHTISDWTTEVAKRILLKTLERLKEGYLEIVCREQTYQFGDPNAPMRGRIEVRDDRAFKRVLLGGDIGFGEAYMDTDWSSPNVVEVVRLVIRNIQLFEQENTWLSSIKKRMDYVSHKMRPNSLKGSRKNIQAHYDLSNDFYQLFLDPTLGYSCGVYEKPDDSLIVSQLQKFDLICRKLQL